jgi:hypothetical protein
MYRIINDRNDCLKLQNDLDKFKNWCEINGFSLNTDKCLYITFTRNQHSILFEYLINQSNLKTVNKIKDLEIILSQVISPSQIILILIILKQCEC